MQIKKESSLKMKTTENNNYSSGKNIPADKSEFNNFSDNVIENNSSNKTSEIEDDGFSEF